MSISAITTIASAVVLVAMAANKRSAIVPESFPC